MFHSGELVILSFKTVKMSDYQYFTLFFQSICHFFHYEFQLSSPDDLIMGNIRGF